MQNLNKSNYFDSIKDGSVLVKVGADWCKDCRRIEPIMTELKKEYDGKVKFFDVNFSEEEDLKDELNIRRIPTLIFYKEGKEVRDRLVEPNSRVDIEKALQTIL